MMDVFESDFTRTASVGTSATTSVGQAIDLTSQFLDAIKEDLSYSDKKVLAALLRQRASDLDDNPIPF